MKYKTWLPLIAFLLIHHYSWAQQFDEQVQRVMNEANIDSLIYFVKELSGEIQTTINGVPDTIATRNKNFEGNEKAAIYIRQKLEGYGLDTREQTFIPLGKNVYAVQPGEDFADQIYIICAHYDDMPPLYVAPGADDNASGVAAVIEAARILSKHPTKYTIIYALWDNEEYGLTGSSVYALDAYQNGDDILGVLNLDMIGWDSNNDSKADIHTDAYGNSLQQAQYMLNINQIYNLGLAPIAYYPGTGRSDHASFWDQGYTATLLSEAFWGGDFNVNYHATTDRVEYFNSEFFHKCARLGLGTIASLAELKSVVTSDESKQSVLSFVLNENYPNPFNPETTIQFSLPSSEVVELRIYNSLGQLVRTLASGAKHSAGVHTYLWDGRDNFGLAVSGGVYLIRFEAGHFRAVQKALLLK